MKCSDFIAEFLKNNKIGTVFDFTGGMITNLEDSISRLAGIDCLPVRHEQAAGFAAEGYARAGANFGVAMATSGPGATNLMTAIGSCYFDSTPVLFITGQVNTNDLRSNDKIRQNGFQEMDVVTMVNSITKYAKLVLKQSDILYELEKALFIMTVDRPGPVLLDLPFNVQSADIDPEKLKRFIGSEEHGEMLNIRTELISDISKLSSLLKEAQAPIVLFGNGVKISRTKDQLKDFLDKNNLPSVSSLLGLDQIPNDQKNYLGFIGSYGNRSANIILANADLIIVLGSRLDLRQTGNPSLFANKAKVVHVDIDQYSAKHNFSDYVFLNTDLKSFFAAIEKNETKSKEKWCKFIDLIRNEFKEELNDDPSYCQPNLFFEKFSAVAPINAVVVADVGQNQMWLAQSWKIKNGQSLMFSGGMGAMGFSLPVALGAYYADQTRPIFAFMGDGGFQINIQELETIKKNNLPIKIFVLNNYSLGMVREFQDQYFNKNYQSTVIGYSCPDLEKIATAYGLKYYRINNLIDGDKAYDEIISLSEAAIIEVILSRQSDLKPKVVYGESIENQAPFLNEEKKQKLSKLKKEFLN